MRSGRASKTVGSVSKSACILALIAMVICGFAYRGAAYHFQKSAQMSITLPVPLRTFPSVISGWTGKDAPLDETVAEVAGNDDFCNRLYVNKQMNYWANVYIAYSARPRTMLGHKPDVCYVGAGWVHDDTEESSFVAKSGAKIPCLIHWFHLPQPRQEDLVVLNFYIINGKTSAEEAGFSGIEWRTPNIKGDMARYVAQVQISSTLEDTVRAAATDMADVILKFLPNEKGFGEETEDANSGMP
jgi:hypothetical protein